MTAKVKAKVKEHLDTDYGKAMLEDHGLNYVKKEIFHAIKNQEGDKRKMKYN